MTKINHHDDNDDDMLVSSWKIGIVPVINNEKLQLVVLASRPHERIANTPFIILTSDKIYVC